MKRGIEVYPDRDKTGRWRLNIAKKRGTLTLDEIKAAAREWELDFYLLVLDCYHDPYDFQDGYEPEGDRAELYRADLLFKEEEH